MCVEPVEKEPGKLGLLTTGVSVKLPEPHQGEGSWQTALT